MRKFKNIFGIIMAIALFLGIGNATYANNLKSNHTLFVVKPDNPVQRLFHITSYDFSFASHNVYVLEARHRIGLTDITFILPESPRIAYLYGKYVDNYRCGKLNNKALRNYKWYLFNPNKTC